VKSGKPDKSVAGMGVLKDIRGLLSSNQERKPSAGVDPEEGVNSKIEEARYKEELNSYREQLQKQLEELKKLTRENRELVHNLELLRSGKEVISCSDSVNKKELVRDIAQLEIQKSELDRALADVVELLRVKLKDLLKRIALIFQEAGDGSMAIEFRKGADSLENTENMARFLQILLNE
jgi:chromosome segregation ATPase